MSVSLICIWGRDAYRIGRRIEAHCHDPLVLLSTYGSQWSVVDWTTSTIFFLRPRGGSKGAR